MVQLFLIRWPLLPYLPPLLYLAKDVSNQAVHPFRITSKLLSILTLQPFHLLLNPEGVLCPSYHLPWVLFPMLRAETLPVILFLLLHYRFHSSRFCSPFLQPFEFRRRPPCTFPYPASLSPPHLSHLSCEFLVPPPLAASTVPNALQMLGGSPTIFRTQTPPSVYCTMLLPPSFHLSPIHLHLILVPCRGCAWG